MHRPLIPALALVFLSSKAIAQVNVETFRSELKSKERFLTLEGNLTGRLGNVQGVIAGASIFGGFQVKQHLVFAKAQGDYAAFGGTPSVSKSFAHLRYSYELSSSLFVEVFTQIQQDKFQRLRLRNVEGLGPRFAVLRRKDFELYYGTSYMFEYEDLSHEVGNPESQSTTAHRWSNYISLLARLDDRTRFMSMVYMQPRLDRFSDFRMLWESAITVQLPKPLSLKLALVLRHDSAPPEGVKTTDLESKNSLAVTF